MKLFAVVCIIALQTTAALRVVKGPTRPIVQSISEAFQRTSNDAKLVHTNTIAALALFSIISFGHPSPSFAAGNGNIASDLFAKAESAISLNLQDYNTLDKEWGNAKKLITDNNNILLKASKSLGDVSKQMTGFDVIMSNMIDEDLTASQQLSAEIDSLRLSTGAKYTAAKASSSVPENPSITAPLYLSAEIEANVLEQSEISLKKFVDAIGPPGADRAFKKRSDEVLETLTEMVGRATDIQAEQESGTSEMTQGLLYSANRCRDSLNECSVGGPVGVTRFKGGLKTVDSAQDRFSKLKKEISEQSKALLVIQNDLTKANEALLSVIAEDRNWEDKTGLKLRNGRKVVEKAAQKYGNTLKETIKMNQRLFETNILLLNNESEKGNKKEVSEELKIVSNLLENANKNGNIAESYLKAAQIQGEKEASKYLKFVKPVIAVAPKETVSASVSVADASKTVKIASVKEKK